MPRIELIPDVYYRSNDPYHWEYDNLPLININRKIEAINDAVDNAMVDLRNAAGDQGTMSNRLNQSIAEDGTLLKAAIDAVKHGISEHTDEDGFVRMTEAERAKLQGVATGATSLTIELDLNADGSSDGSSAQFSSGILKVVASETVVPSFDAPNILSFDLNFPTTSFHEHYYGLTPVHGNLSSPNYTDYKVTSTSTPFIDGSLRVFINGVRIFEESAIPADKYEVYAPGASVDDPWTLLYFTATPASGTFELSTAISSTDVIKIDFDISLA